jgi:hypothetical protein
VTSHSNSMRMAAKRCLTVGFAKSLPPMRERRSKKHTALGELAVFKKFAVALSAGCWLLAADTRAPRVCRGAGRQIPRRPRTGRVGQGRQATPGRVTAA